jgi:hypothetical protein
MPSRSSRASKAKPGKRPPKKKRAFRFSDLTDVHVELDALFAEHREALLGGGLKTALELLEPFWKILRAHIRVEEVLLLPAYTQRVGRVEGGTAELFLAEHRKMERFVQEFRRTIKRLASRRGPPKRRDILALLDREALLLSLMEHHAERENTFLYALLDKATTPAERAQAAEAIRRIEVRRSQIRR